MFTVATCRRCRLRQAFTALIILRSISGLTSPFLSHTLSRLLLHRPVLVLSRLLTCTLICSPCIVTQDVPSCPASSRHSLMYSFGLASAMIPFSTLHLFFPLFLKHLSSIANTRKALILSQWSYICMSLLPNLIVNCRGSRLFILPLFFLPALDKSVLIVGSDARVAFTLLNN